EREGFEPSRRYKRLPDFESGTFNRSATSPDPDAVAAGAGPAIIGAPAPARQPQGPAAARPPLGRKKNSPLSWPANWIGAYSGVCASGESIAPRARLVATSWNRRWPSSRRLLSCSTL